MSYLSGGSFSIICCGEDHLKTDSELYVRLQIHQRSFSSSVLLNCRLTNYNSIESKCRKFVGLQLDVLHYTVLYELDFLRSRPATALQFHKLPSPSPVGNKQHSVIVMRTWFPFFGAIACFMSTSKRYRFLNFV